ncbi:hypothetical protein [Brevibacillus migulae]|uniref:hypothetical protein n=1 Tax=Brevibacillus migulae TaxID=1644114 RepID=UPI00106EE9AA|nr:hypothetical protein [Brevibacillus migulae]
MEISFKNEKHVLQVCYKKVSYTKNDRGFQNRESIISDWPQMIESSSGIVTENDLIIPACDFEHKQVEQSDLIVLADYLVNDATAESHLLKKQGQRHYLTLKNGAAPYEILRFFQKETFEVHLNYSLFGVGIPKRDNFKLAELKKGSGIRVRINGKLDFSASARRERIYTEHDILMKYYGCMKNCTFVSSTVEFGKKVNPDEYKLIDLRKTLY